MLEVTTITRIKCHKCGWEHYTSPSLTSEKDGDPCPVCNDTGTPRIDNAKTYNPYPDPLGGLRELEKQHGHFDGVNADEYVKDQRGR